MRFVPIYGWGWFNKDGNLVDVPPPFDLRRETAPQGLLEEAPNSGQLILDEDLIFGQVEAVGHALDNMHCLLWRRHGSDYSIKSFYLSLEGIDREQPVCSEIVTGYVTRS